MARKPLFAPEFREKWGQLPQWLRAHLDADVIRVLHNHCPLTILCAADGIKEAVGTIFLIYFATDEIAGEQIFLDCNFRPDDSPEPPYRDVMALPFIPGIDLENFIDQYEPVEFSVPQNNNFDTKHVREEAVWSMHVSLVVDFSSTIQERFQLPVPCQITYWTDSYITNLLEGVIGAVRSSLCIAGEPPPSDNFGALRTSSNQVTLNTFLEPVIHFLEEAIHFDMSNNIFELNWMRAGEDWIGSGNTAGAATTTEVIDFVVNYRTLLPPGGSPLPRPSVTLGTFTDTPAWHAIAADTQVFAGGEIDGALAVGTPIPRPDDLEGSDSNERRLDPTAFDYAPSMRKVIVANGEMGIADGQHSRLTLAPLLCALLPDYKLKDPIQLGLGLALTAGLSENRPRRASAVLSSAGGTVFVQRLLAGLARGAATGFINRRSLCGRVIEAVEFDRLHSSAAADLGGGDGFDITLCVTNSANTGLAPTVAAILDKSGAIPKAVSDIPVTRSPPSAVWAVPVGHI
jgi:hypothetical protein